MACCSAKARCYSVFGIGIFLINLSIVLILCWPSFNNYLLKSELSLSTTSKSYDMWLETPIPIYLDLYLFNWTNAAEVEKNWEIKPKFKELGPYVFLEKHKRVDLIWNNNNTVTFKQIRTWKFQPQLSRSLDDNVTNINVIAATVGNMVRNKHYLIRRAVDLLMRERGEKLYVTHTADELFFKGYDDKLLDLLKNVSMPGFDIPFDKFGWFYGRDGNPDYDGVFNMYTGQDDMLKLGMLDRWNGMANTGMFPGHCGDVEGSTGELWPPVVNNKTVKLFASDMCSSVVLNYTSSVEKLGVEGSRFTAQKYAFDNGKFYPEQNCYDMSMPQEYAATGVRNISRCRFGAPAFLSFPHFYLADDSYKEAVEGMNPNKSKHELFMEVEPQTGIPLGVEAKIQINILVQPIKGIKMFDDAKRIFLPVLWFNQRASLTEEYANMLKLLLNLPNIGRYTGYGIFCIGLLLLFIGSVITFQHRWKGGEVGPPKDLKNNKMVDGTNNN